MGILFLPLSRYAWSFTLAVAIFAAACDRTETTFPKSPALSGDWIDENGIEYSPGGTCCFLDPVRDPPCPPDTLRLGEDGSMRFTSVPDEPASYFATSDTFYRIRGAGEFRDTMPFEYSRSGDTLQFVASPLCPSKGIPARYRKVR